MLARQVLLLLSLAALTSWVQALGAQPEVSPPKRGLHAQKALWPALYRPGQPAGLARPARAPAAQAPVQATKREKPMLVGYGWEQCEFSPMSCLLRRRRRAA